ncbi:MAG: hypothetical protein UX87_C0019G0011 [Candidatus Amesbacteria bacterium GW2011_GWA1_47_16]|uniref:Uncharacterized protein n=3 Tax=Candidatus Amesiibacteriota TaxID=1752730 RepID=A0A0G1S1K7_9BACT|nr:MAG: hypothetical protein UX86_C0030G0006 [Candidatus Amesbacteria bacterium GW2011_GWC1_47_15]KKU63644.1 MAG: hypothetical protein UX87_C0019G0011 [Candidatus Amesbacteria bacterium GW2011_GWA1_47_16]
MGNDLWVYNTNMPRAECRNEKCERSTNVFESEDFDKLLIMVASHYWYSAKEVKTDFGAFFLSHECTTFTIDGDREHIISFNAGRWEELISGSFINMGTLPRGSPC